MRVAIKQQGSDWSVVVVGGKFAGQEIGVVESIALADVTLNKHTIEGTPLAVHGATFADSVFDCPKMVKGLGINQPFDTRVRNRLRYDPDVGFINPERGSVMSGARFVTVHKGQMFWR